MFTIIVEFLGIKWFPNLVSSAAFLTTVGTTEYFLKDSLRHINVYSKFPSADNEGIWKPLVITLSETVKLPFTQLSNKPLLLLLLLLLLLSLVLLLLLPLVLSVLSLLLTMSIVMPLLVSSFFPLLIKLGHHDFLLL